MEFEVVHLLLTQEDRELLNKRKSELGVKTDAEFFIHCLRNMGAKKFKSKVLYTNVIGLFQPTDAAQVKFKLNPDPAPQVVNDIVNKMMEKGIVNVNIKDEKIVSGDTTFNIKAVKTGKGGLGRKGGAF